MRLEVDVECLVVLQVPSGNPEVVLGSISRPSNEKLEVVTSYSLVIEDMFDRVLGDVVDQDGSRFVEGTRGVFRVVVIDERFNVGCMKGGEKVRSVWHIKGDCRRRVINVNDNVGPIETRHKFGYSEFAGIFVLTATVKGTEHDFVTDSVVYIWRPLQVCMKGLRDFRDGEIVPSVRDIVVYRFYNVPSCKFIWRNLRR